MASDAIILLRICQDPTDKNTHLYFCVREIIQQN